MIFEDFDGDDIVGAFLPALDNLSKGSSAKELQHLVLRGDAVEDLMLHQLIVPITSSPSFGVGGSYPSPRPATGGSLPSHRPVTRSVVVVSVASPRCSLIAAAGVVVVPPVGGVSGRPGAARAVSTNCSLAAAPSCSLAAVGHGRPVTVVTDVHHVVVPGNDARAAAGNGSLAAGVLVCDADYNSGGARITSTTARVAGVFSAPLATASLLIVITKIENLNIIIIIIMLF